MIRYGSVAFFAQIHWLIASGSRIAGYGIPFSHMQGAAQYNSGNPGLFGSTSIASHEKILCGVPSSSNFTLTNLLHFFVAFAHITACDPCAGIAHIHQAVGKQFVCMSLLVDFHSYHPSHISSWCVPQANVPKHIPSSRHSDEGTKNTGGTPICPPVISVPFDGCPFHPVIPKKAERTKRPTATGTSRSLNRIIIMVFSPANSYCYVNPHRSQ